MALFESDSDFALVSVSSESSGPRGPGLTLANALNAL